MGTRSQFKPAAAAARTEEQQAAKRHTSRPVKREENLPCDAGANADVGDAA